MSKAPKTAKESRKIPKKVEKKPIVFNNIENRASEASGNKVAGKELAEGLIKAMNALVTQAASRQKQSSRRLIKANYRSVTGWLANEVGANAIPFESTLERDCAYVALFDQRVLELEAQPETIPYQMQNGRQSHYTPDYQVTYQFHGATHQAVLEVKYLNELQEKEPELIWKLDAAKRWFEKSDKTFHVVTERQLRPSFIENIRFLYRQRLQRNFEVLAANAFYERISSSLPTSMSQVLDLHSSSRLERARNQSYLWGLIASETVSVDLEHEITPETIVRDYQAQENAPLFFQNGEPWRSDGTKY